MGKTARSDPALRLLADIGGTNVRFALQVEGGQPGHTAVYRAAEHPTLSAAIETYLAEYGRTVSPGRGAFAVAGPISGDHVKMTNRGWSFSIGSIRRRFRLASLEVMNDFAAVALAIPRLRGKDKRKIGGGRRVEGAPIAVLGAGTGLGVSYLVPSAAGPIAVPTEGGHVTLAASNEYETAVIRSLREQFGHVSAERVLSGPGLVSLYKAIAPVIGQPVRDLTPMTITRRAADRSCPASAATVDMFCDLVGTVAADLALSTGARGGVYLGGGIIPNLGAAFKASRFRQRFESKGRFSSYLAAIPTHVITRPQPAFLGLAHLLDLRATDGG